MSDNHDFNLDDILNEFQDIPQGDAEELSGELDDLLGSWLTDAPDADSGAEEKSGLFIYRCRRRSFFLTV